MKFKIQYSLLALLIIEWLPILAGKFDNYFNLSGNFYNFVNLEEKLYLLKNLFIASYSLRNRSS